MDYLLKLFYLFDIFHIKILHFETYIVLTTWKLGWLFLIIFLVLYLALYKCTSLTLLDICNKNDVKPFSMNGKKVSKFFVANYLWDMMEEEWWQIFSKYIWQSMRHISQEAITWSMHIDVWTFEHCSLFELVKCPVLLDTDILYFPTQSSFLWTIITCIWM